MDKSRNKRGRYEYGVSNNNYFNSRPGTVGQDRLDRCALDLYKYLKQSNRISVSSYEDYNYFEFAYIEYLQSKSVREPFPFQSVWPLFVIHLEAFFFVSFLRQSRYFMRKISKDNLNSVYTSEYQARCVVPQGPTVVVANYHKVLKSAIFTGKLFELDGYIFVGDTESALAQALIHVPDEAEMTRREQLKQQRPDSYCEVCDVRCHIFQLHEHLQGRRHKVQSAISQLRDEAIKDQLLLDKCGVRVLLTPSTVGQFNPASGSYCVEMEPNERLTFMVTVNNDNAIQARATARRDGYVTVEEMLFLFKTDNMFFNDVGHGLLRCRQPVLVRSGSSLDVHITCTPNVASRTVVPFMVVCRNDSEQFRILRFITIECVKDKSLFRMLKPHTAYLAGSMNYVTPPLTQSQSAPSDSDSDNEEAKPSTTNALALEQPKRNTPETSGGSAVLLGHVATYANWLSQSQPTENSEAAISYTNANKESLQVDQVGDQQIVRAPKVATIRKASEPSGKTIGTPLRLGQLGEHAVSTRARRLHRTAAKLHSRNRMSVANDVLDTLLLQKVDETNIAMRFELLLHLEEVQMELDLPRHCVKNAKLARVRNRRKNDDGNEMVYTLNVPGVVENRPGVVRGDILLVTSEHQPNMVYEAAVDAVDGALLRILCPCNFEYIENVSVSTVHFQVDRLPLRLQHETLQVLKRVFARSKTQAQPHLNKLSANSVGVGELKGSAEAVYQDRLRVMLFPSRSRYTAFCQQPSQVKPLAFYNRSLNPEQQRCVQNILQNTHHPVPFLIYGPPGTGKTVTLSEAVKQIYNCCPDCFILACAPENTSADHLVQTITGNSNVEPRKVLRLYAASCYNKVPDFVKLAKCTVDLLEDGYPTVEQIKSYRIVITTLNTAARLAFSGFPNDHFTHLFVDEAGHAMESEVYIPIAFLLNLTRTTGGQLIMAGDPRQLGVTVRSSVATKYHLERSLFERLMTNSDLYLTESCAVDLNRKLLTVPDCLTPLNIPPSAPVEYDERLLVKLRRNYRSHDAIIAFSRQRFYHNQLDAFATEDSKHRFLGWELLPNKNYPVIFHPVIGSDEREGSSPSYFNRNEVMVVDTYLNALLVEKRGVKIEPKDIGIISPYRAHNIKIRKLIEAKHYADNGKNATATTSRSEVGILVSTVEEFQGQERVVVIISTVRSSAKLLRTDAEYQVGFVDRKQRADSDCFATFQADGGGSSESSAGSFELGQEMNVHSKRLNVALTRAKSLLIVVGNPFILEQDRNWKIWLDQCAANGAWTTERSQVEKLRGTDIINDVISQENNDMCGPDNVSMIEMQEEPQWTRRE